MCVRLLYRHIDPHIDLVVRLDKRHTLLQVEARIQVRGRLKVLLPTTKSQSLDRDETCESRAATCSSRSDTSDHRCATRRRVRSPGAWRRRYELDKQSEPPARSMAVAARIRTIHRRRYHPGPGSKATTSSTVRILSLRVSAARALTWPAPLCRVQTPTNRPCRNACNPRERANASSFVNSSGGSRNPGRKRYDPPTPREESMGMLRSSGERCSVAQCARSTSRRSPAPLRDEVTRLQNLKHGKDAHDWVIHLNFNSISNLRQILSGMPRVLSNSALTGHKEMDRMTSATATINILTAETWLNNWQGTGGHSQNHRSVP